MPVVTITGETASGARDVGQAVAGLLGAGFVDQQLIVRAAQRCGVTVGAVAEHDERRASFRQRLASIINTFLERSAFASSAGPLTGATGIEAILSRSYAEMTLEKEEPQLSDRLYLEAMSGIIRELAAAGDVVILGRGSQMILADMPGALHALCIAPEKVRAHRLAEREGIGVEEAARRAAESDRARAAFYRTFWKVDVQDPALYDITIDTSRLHYDAAAQVVAAAARAKTGVGA